jgi:hypothetical protein
VVSAQDLHTVPPGLGPKTLVVFRTSLPADCRCTEILPCLCSLGKLDCFPPELLETVLGSLDVRTLCTTRLVCKTLSTAASRCVRSIRVSPEYLRDHPDTTFDSFPCLDQVAITGILAEDLPLLAQPAISHAVTDVEFHLVEAPTRGYKYPRPNLPLLPNLRSMTIVRFDLDNDFYFPPSLQELLLQNSVCDRNGGPVLRLTGLTSLRLTVYDKNDSPHPFRGLTSLSALQKLDIHGPASLFLCIGALPLLTHLDWTCLDLSGLNEGQPFDLAPLTRLHSLVHLGLTAFLDSWLTFGHIRTIGQMTSLRSLKLRGNDAGGSPGLDLDATLLIPLSGLTKLTLDGGCMDVGSLGRMNIEGLQDLMLWDAHELGPEVASVMERATGLERLDFTWGYRPSCLLEAEPLSLALSGMSRLQSLRLSPGPLRCESCFQAIGLLTGLTALHYRGDLITHADVELCACLTKLRSLTLEPEQFSPWGPITVDHFLALAMLPELTSLVMGKRVGFWGYPATHDLAEWYNSERHRKGWPSLRLEFRE